MQLRHALVIERHLATDQNVENNTETPNINFRAGVLPCLEQFGGCKVQTAAERLQKASWRKQIAETKVDNFDITRLADQDVLDLQVSMHDAVPVTVIQRTRDLAGEFAGLLLFQFAMRNDVVQHLTPVDIFEEHVPVVRGSHNISHPADVWVAGEADNGGLSSCSDFFRAVCSFRFATVAVFLGRESRYNLYSDLRSGLVMVHNMA